MENDKWKMTSPCTIVDRLATFTPCGGAGGLVVLAGFKPVAGRREAAWVGSIPTRLRQPVSTLSTPVTRSPAGLSNPEAAAGSLRDARR